MATLASNLRLVSPVVSNKQTGEYMDADIQMYRIGWLKDRGVTIDVRERAHIVVMRGKVCVGIFPTLDDAIEAAFADVTAHVPSSLDSYTRGY